MKKIVCCILAIFVLSGCIPTHHIETLKIQGIENINYEKLTQNLNSHVKFILYIGRPDCGDCQEFYPILEEYIHNHQGTGIYYLNIKEFRDQAKADDATQQEKDFYDNLYEELHFDWTPTIHIIEDGKFLKTYKYLDEDYYKIKDRNEQKKKRQDFLDDFETFMNDYFKEDSL